MYSQPTIFPLNVEGTIYALQDDKGAIIGTGTREVCEFLVHIVSPQTRVPVSPEARRRTTPRANVRSAIVI